jgi:hypothetical protein
MTPQQAEERRLMDAYHEAVLEHSTAVTALVRITNAVRSGWPSSFHKYWKAYRVVEKAREKVEQLRLELEAVRRR